MKPNHTLIVKATENCSNKPSNITLPKSSQLSRSYHSALTRTNSQNKYLDWFNRYKHSRSLRSVSDDNFYDDVVADHTDEHQDNVHFQSLVSGILHDDNTLVQVVVEVDDINDNSPEFVSKVFTGKFKQIYRSDGLSGLKVIPNFVSPQSRWCNHSCRLWNENNVNKSHRS